MQPMLVIQLLQLGIKPCTAEIFVDDFKTCKDASEKFFKGEGCEVGGEQVVERGSRRSVGGIEAYTNDEVVGARREGGVYKNAADFDVGFLGRFGGILGVFLNVRKELWRDMEVG